jgi:hypothetical protein
MKLIISAILGLGLLAFQPDYTQDIATNTQTTTQTRADTTKFDPETGLIVDENLYMAKAQCTSCHSAKLVTANNFSRDGWKQKIRWMQANHNLWELGDAEKIVLDYLEKNYGPKISTARRAPLKDVKWYDLK